MDLTLKLQHGGMSDVTPEPLRSRHIRFCSDSNCALLMDRNAAPSDQCSPKNKAWATVVGERIFIRLFLSLICLCTVYA